MEPQFEARMRQHEEKLEAIWQSVEKTRKYFLILMWVAILSVVVPMIGLLFAIPTFLSTYSSLDTF